jgi:hypothetical protein
MSKKTSLFRQLLFYWLRIRCRGHVFIEPLTNKDSLSSLHHSGLQPLCPNIFVSHGRFACGLSYNFPSTLKMEAIGSSESSVNTISTRCHIPEDCFLHSHRRENFKSYTWDTCYKVHNSVHIKNVQIRTLVWFRNLISESENITS